MTSNRSYRSTFSLEEAYDRIINGANPQFNPKLVEVFKQVFSKWIEIAKSQ
ncbi:hypothetical protein OCB72_30960 [Bacillus cereus]|nr:hypothetical protein [Bacillus cereus]